MVPPQARVRERMDFALSLWRVAALDRVGLTVGESRTLLAADAHTEPVRALWSEASLPGWDQRVAPETFLRTSSELIGIGDVTGLRRSLWESAARAEMAQWALPAGAAGGAAERAWALCAYWLSLLEGAGNFPWVTVRDAGRDAGDPEVRRVLAAVHGRMAAREPPGRAWRADGVPADLAEAAQSDDADERSRAFREVAQARFARVGTVPGFRARTLSWVGPAPGVVAPPASSGQVARAVLERASRLEGTCRATDMLAEIAAAEVAVLGPGR